MPERPSDPHADPAADPAADPRAAPKADPHAPQEIGFKDMCARFDVTPRTLRYYEYIELLSPRREGRARLYGPREVARMTLILRGRRCGFSLEEIRQWLLMREAAGTEAQMRAFVTLADAQIEALAERREQIAETIEELRRLRDAARSGGGGGEDAPTAPDREP